MHLAMRFIEMGIAALDPSYGAVPSCSLRFPDPGRERVVGLSAVLLDQLLGVFEQRGAVAR
jgi:hypothetical protein